MEPLADIVERVLDNAHAAWADWATAEAGIPVADAVPAAARAAASKAEAMADIRSVAPSFRLDADADIETSQPRPPTKPDRLSRAITPAAPSRSLAPAGSPPSDLPLAATPSGRIDPIADRLAWPSAAPASRRPANGPRRPSLLPPAPVATDQRAGLLSLAGDPTTAAPMRAVEAATGALAPLRATDTGRTPTSTLAGVASALVPADRVRSDAGSDARAERIAPNGMATPLACSLPEDRGPIRVIVVNGRNLADGVAGHMAASLDQPQAGLTGPDPRLSPWSMLS